MPLNPGAFLMRLGAWLKKKWVAVVEFHKDRQIVHEVSSSEEEFQKHAEKRFNSAKKLADFVGMITSLAFAQFAWRYFIYNAQRIDGIYSYIFGFCWVSAFGLSLILAQRIGVVIFFWEVTDVRKAQNGYVKALLLIVSITSTILIYMGIYKMVSDLALASALIGEKK